jgi:hypothetical protein
MKKIVMCLGLFSALHAVFADVALPHDVETFVERREGCDHMRGETPEPAEKKRMREVNREIAKLCKGTDNALTRLKKKYARDQMVMQRLSEFEDSIEAMPSQQAGRAAGYKTR